MAIDELERADILKGKTKVIMPVKVNGYNRGDNPYFENRFSVLRQGWGCLRTFFPAPKRVCIYLGMGK